MSSTLKKELGDPNQDAAQSDLDFDRKDNEIISESSHSDKKSLHHEEPHLPIWGFPNFFASIIEEVAEVYQIHRDFVICGAVSALGAAVGKKQKSFDGKYTNYANSLWIALVAPTGYGKTEALKFLTRPLFDINKRLNKNYRNAHEDWSRSGKSEGNPEPKEHRLVVHDTTLESLYEKLDLDDSLLQYSDELPRFMKNINRYTKGSNIEPFLEIFSNGNVIIDRKSGGGISLEAPALGIIGGIQPSMLAECFGEFMRINNGFNQRFLFCYPEVQIQTTYNEKGIDERTAEFWRSIIIGYYDGKRGEYDEIYKQFGNMVTITGEAKELYIAYWERQQNKIASSTNEYINGIYSKLQTIVERYALLVAIINDTIGNEMKPEHMKFAIESMEAFEYWALKAYDRMRGNEKKEMDIYEAIRVINRPYPIKNQSEFARATGMPQSMVSYALNNKR